MGVGIRCVSIVGFHDVQPNLRPIARDLLSGFTIAFLIQSVDHSLFAHLILIQSLENIPIALLIQSLDL